MTSEQQELNLKFFYAIGTLNAVIPHFYTNDDELTDAAKMLVNAREIFMELHEDWRRLIVDDITP